MIKTRKVSFVNEQKGIVHADVQVSLFVGDMWFDTVSAAGRSVCHVGDAFNRKFGVILAEARGKKTALKLMRNSLKKTIDRLSKELVEVEAKIDEAEIAIKSLVDTTKV